VKISLPQTLVVLVILVALVAAQQLFSLPGSSSFMRAAQDAMHAPWFFTVVVVLCWWLRTIALPLRVLLIVVSAAVLAVGTEVVQIYVAHREASVGDLQRNTVGGVLGLIFGLALMPGDRLRFSAAALGVAATALIALVIYTALPLWQALELRRYRAELAPTLVDFSDARASQFLSTNGDSWFRTGAAAADWSSYAGRQVLRLEFGADEYPTLYVNELMQRWAPFNTLVLDVFVLDGQPLPLTVAVRYEGSVGTSAYYESTLRPGANNLLIPRAKFIPDDATALRVDDLLIYTTREHAGRAILVGTIRMEY